jgi:hypothetical protein
MQCAGFSNPLAIVGARSAIAHGAGQHLRVRSMFGGRVPRSCGSSSLLRGPARQGGVLAAGMQSSAEEQGFKKLYRVEDEKIKHTVILPIGEETTSREIECTITKTCLLLSVDGKRVIDGELWGQVIPDESYWEIDEHGKDNRCIIIRLQKKSKEDWPFVIRGDYDVDAMNWANRRTVSRKDFSKDDVEKALQLIVSLLKPSGLSAASPAEPESPPVDETLPGAIPLKKIPPMPGSEEMKRQWDQAVLETKEEEWRETADAMSKAFSDGRSSDEIQELLSVTQEALQGGPGSIDVELAPIAGLVFVRHSQTDKAQGDSVEEDLVRSLTEDGRSLATSSRRWFGTLLNAERLVPEPHTPTPLPSILHPPPSTLCLNPDWKYGGVGGYGSGGLVVVMVLVLVLAVIVLAVMVVLAVQGTVECREKGLGFRV